MPRPRETHMNEHMDTDLARSSDKGSGFPSARLPMANGDCCDASLTKAGRDDDKCFGKHHAGFSL